MNIYNYIDEYGLYSFKEKPINEIDCVIFSFLSYANFKDVIQENQKITIKNAGRIHLGVHPNKEKNIIAVREGNKLLHYIKDTKRYKDCILFNYEYIGTEKMQFGAISIEYQPNKVFVSFEGTDSLFSGWMENFMLSYQFPTQSHLLAIGYLNRHFTLKIKNLIVGGHSKGGNLALVASMYTNIWVKKLIKRIYNVDGPGLLDKEFNSNKYQKIQSKYLHIIPDYSLVGLFLRHSNDIVVESTNKGILAHNIVYWQIKKTTFKRATLSKLSKELDKEIEKWFSKYNDEDKKKFIKNLEDILIKANINSILELKEKNSNIIKLIYESKEMSDNTKQILIEFIKILITCFGETKKEEIKEFITTMFKIKKQGK